VGIDHTISESPESNAIQASPSRLRQSAVEIDASCGVRIKVREPVVHEMFHANAMHHANFLIGKTVYFFKIVFLFITFFYICSHLHVILIGNWQNFLVFLLCRGSSFRVIVHVGIQLLLPLFNLRWSICGCVSIHILTG
jgi:hypothetical protein